MIGITFALVAAISWGTADFCGGLASRKLNQFQVLIIANLSSLVLMFLLVVIWQENFPSVNTIFIAVVAGISGGLGLAALYKGLSLGNSAVVAPVAGLVGAIIPTLVGLIIEGLPSFLKLIGFVLSIVGIWLVSRSKDGNSSVVREGLGLGFLAGIGFGMFLALIAQLEGNQIIMPLIFSKLASIIISYFMLRIRKISFPRLTASPIAVWSGFLDVGANILYFFATQFTRLDIAALLSSLYPAVTILLSSIILKEKLSSYQWAGVSVCLVAIMLITAG